MLPIAVGLVPPRNPGGRPAIWAATGRSGGVSRPPYDTLNLASHVGDDEEAVAANRALLAVALGSTGDRVAVMAAVHGAEVATVTDPGVTAGVDGLVTQEPNLVIIAMGADCVPLALIGADGRTVAVAHCGWPGLTLGIVDTVVAAVERLGSGIAAAVLGPAVCGTCYPVPQERAAEVAARCSPSVAEAAVVTCPDGQPGIDVRRGVQARLLELGVAPEAIAWAGGCTVEDLNLFSFRRDGVTGRQGIAVRLGEVARMGA